MTDDDHFDADVLTKDLPFFAKGPAKDLVEKLNSYDTNHDGQDDVTQIARLLKRALPFLAAILPHVNWRGALTQLLDNPNVIAPDARSEVKAHTAELFKIGEELATLHALQEHNK